MKGISRNLNNLTSMEAASHNQRALTLGGNSKIKIKGKDKLSQSLKRLNWIRKTRGQKLGVPGRKCSNHPKLRL
jgi:hypothetical protein